MVSIRCTTTGWTVALLSLLDVEVLSFAIAVDFAGDFVVGLAFACIAGILGDLVGDRDRLRLIGSFEYTI